MTTASTAAPDLKKVAASFNDGLRRLALMDVAAPEMQANSSVSQFRQKLVSLNDQVKEIRSRSAEIQKAKEDLERLQKELKKGTAEVKTAKSNLEALSQKVGAVAFREFLAGRMVDIPASQNRRDIQQQIDALSQEKEQAAQAAHTGFADKVKNIAHSTALSGRLLLLNQKVASADRSLGAAIIEMQHDEQVLAKDAIDLLTEVKAARKAIADCEANVNTAQRQLDDRRSQAAAQLGITEADSSHFDGEYKKCVELLFDLECGKLSARWECGQALLSTPPTALPEHVQGLFAELTTLASDHPGACTKPAVDKATLIADLKEQIALLHEDAGKVIFDKGLFKDTLSAEFAKVAAATIQERTNTLRLLGKAAFANPDPMMAMTDPTIHSLFTEAQAIALTIKELSGESLVGTDGKAAPTSIYVTVGSLVVVGLLVLLCCGVLSPAIEKVRQTARNAKHDATRVSSQPQQSSAAEKQSQDFIPHIPGTSRDYIHVIYPPGGPVAIVTLDHEQHKDDGLIESTIVKHGRLKNAEQDLALDNIEWLVDSGITSTSYHRVNGGFVEQGDRRFAKGDRLEASGSIEWEPILKLGAKQGDTWEHTPIPELTMRYTITQFSTWNGKPAVTVRTESPSGMIGGGHIVATHVYASGIGEVESKAILIQANKAPSTTYERRFIDPSVSPAPSVPRNDAVAVDDEALRPLMNLILKLNINDTYKTLTFGKATIAYCDMPTAIARKFGAYLNDKDVLIAGHTIRLKQTEKTCNVFYPVSSEYKNDPKLKELVAPAMVAAAAKASNFQDIQVIFCNEDFSIAYQWRSISRTK